MKKYSKSNVVFLMILSSIVSVTLMYAVNGSGTIDAQSEVNCDVNNDGKVTVMDLNIIKQNILTILGDREFDVYEEARNKTYDHVINSVYSSLSEAANGKYESNENKYGSYWIKEMADLYKDKVLENTGFAVKDIDEDGVPELIIGEIENNETNTGSSVGIMYTCPADELKMVLEGWSRNSYTLLDEGVFLNIASSGAMSTSYKTYWIDSETCSLACDTNIFTAPIGEDGTEMGVYISQSAECDAEEAYKLEMTHEELLNNIDKVLEKAVDLELTPFSSYSDTLSVFAARADVMDITASEGYNQFEDNTKNTVFIALSDVTDFKIIHVKYGDETVETEEFKLDKFEYGKVISAGLVFNGDLPEYKITFIDADGKNRAYNVTVSGEDGLINLEEIKLV